MQLTHEFMEGMVADLNTQYQTTELDNVLMLPNAPHIEPEQILFGFVFINGRPSALDLMEVETRFHFELKARGLSATFRTRPLQDYRKKDASVYFVIAETVALEH